MVKPWMVSLVGFSAWACGGGPDVDLQRPARSQAEQVAQATQLSLQADEAHQPVGRVFGAEVRNGEVRYLAPTDLPVAAGVPAEAGASEVAPPSRGEGAIHPRLEADLDSVAKGRAADRRVDVVVTFKQTLKLPRFPEPNVREARDSAENRAALARGAALVASIEAARAKTYDARKATLERQHGVIERERFWLIDGMLANVPLGRIRGLANHPDVQYVEYDQSDAPPPANLISDGRFLMRSDLFFGFTGSWIGMLDTGVRSSHSVFMNPGRITFTYDCNSGTSTTCNGTTPGDCWSPSHGTASANILSGNANLGDAYRGVTQITIDSFKVYTNDNCGYNVTAGQRAFARAVALSDKVILANIQERTSDIGATATAANNAYDAGVVVIGAAGNYGAQGASTVSAPGNATKVLAIGAIDVTSQALEANSGRGPSPDGRTKPDLTAPTNVFAAAVGSDTATRSTTYGGTSGATPFGAGAAALARNFLRGNLSTVDPGQVYAFLIMSGQNFSSPATDNNKGAGLIKLYVGDTSMQWGSVLVSPNSSVNVTMDASFWVNGTNFIDVGIWWPQGLSHTNIDLRLNRPNGTTAASSLSTRSVFEKVRVEGTGLPSGAWKIRITNTGSVTQRVYWSRRFST